MNKYEITRLATDKAFAAMAEFRQAEHDALRYCGMACDGNSAEEIYRNALDHCGISRSETSSLNVYSLKALLKHRPAPGSRAWRNAPAMAYDGKPGDSPLNAILADI